MINKKYKIAVQLFGNLRTFKKCSPNLHKYLLDNYDCDIFMHTWDTLDHSTKTWHNYQIKDKNINIEKEVKKYYPMMKSLKVETQKPVDMGTFKVVNREMSVFGMHSMYHSMSEANLLRQKYEKDNNIKYDFVLMIRPDILLQKKFEIDSFIENKTKKKISNSFFFAGYIAKGLVNDFKQLNATDVMFFSCPKVINKILNTKDELLKNYKKNMLLKDFPPEFFFINHIEGLGFQPNFINYLKDDGFDILRNEFALKKKRYKKYIQIHIKNKRMELYLLRGVIQSILRVRVNLFGLLIDIGIGKI
jgi:hypothetical protein